jgi:hypothetical protein
MAENGPMTNDIQMNGLQRPSERAIRVARMTPRDKMLVMPCLFTFEFLLFTSNGGAKACVE